MKLPFLRTRYMKCAKTNENFFLTKPPQRGGCLITESLDGGQFIICR